MLKASNNKLVKCRICKEDHWTTQCPYKETLGPLRDSLAGAMGEKEEGAEGKPKEAAQQPAAAQPQTGGKYIPPSRRGGDSSARDRIGESMPDRRRSKLEEIFVHFVSYTLLRSTFGAFNWPNNFTGCPSMVNES